MFAFLTTRKHSGSDGLEARLHLKREVRNTRHPDVALEAEEQSYWRIRASSGNRLLKDWKRRTELDDNPLGSFDNVPVREAHHVKTAFAEGALFVAVGCDPPTVGVMVRAIYLNYGVQAAGVEVCDAVVNRNLILEMMVCEVCVENKTHNALGQCARPVAEVAGKLLHRDNALGGQTARSLWWW